MTSDGFFEILLTSSHRITTKRQSYVVVGTVCVSMRMLDVAPCAMTIHAFDGVTGWIAPPVHYVYSFYTMSWAVPQIVVDKLPKRQRTVATTLEKKKILLLDSQRS